MNNEEKILDSIDKMQSILTILAGDMYIVKASVSKLEAGQAKLEAGQAKLEAGQASMRTDIAKLEAGQARLEDGQVSMRTDIAKLETGQARLEAELKDTKHILIRFENDYKLDRGGIFDKLDDLQKKAAASIENQENIDERINNHDLRIIRLENRVLAAR